MFENLSFRLQKVLRDLRGEGRLSQEHLTNSLRQIRIALLEADVHFSVVKSFISGVQEKALGLEVMRSLSPGQQVVKIVNEELIQLLGPDVVELKTGGKFPVTVLLVGLQGSGKTTTTGKLGAWLNSKGSRAMMVSTDVHRPAAIEQLRVVGSVAQVSVEDPEIRDPVQRTCLAWQRARTEGFDYLLVDTAGRLHVDGELMEELERIESAVDIQEVLLVADAMTGQDAVNSARSFGERCQLSGIILTKMDGDARGGAALSIRKVTGKPIKFVGTGEGYTDFEVFQPERMAGRILGMGDVLSLIEKAKETVTQKEAQELLEKVQRDSFTLEDFRLQLQQLRKLGSLDQIMGMFPQVGLFKGLGKLKIGEEQLDYLEAMINSMTSEERANYRIIKGSRRLRIARGSGRPVSEVNRLLKQYVHSRNMMKQLKRGFRGRSLSEFDFPF